MSTYQDFTPVVIRKDAASSASAAKRSGAGGASIVARHDSEGARLAKLADADAPPKPKILDPECRKAMVAARVAKKQSQAELNVQLSMKPNTIKGIEAGLLLPNPKELTAIGRALGIKMCYFKPADTPTA